MPAADYLGDCCCGARGAGANGDTLEDGTMPSYDPSVIAEQSEAFFPVGSVATLETEFPADRGLWVAPRLVSEFEKMPNGNWVSQPGQDVYYPTAVALNMAAPVRRIDTPDLPPNPDYQLPPAWLPPPLPELQGPRADVMPWEFGAPDPSTPPFYDGGIGGTTPADALGGNVSDVLESGAAPTDPAGAAKAMGALIAIGGGLLLFLFAKRRRR